MPERTLGYCKHKLQGESVRAWGFGPLVLPGLQGNGEELLCLLRAPLVHRLAQRRIALLLMAMGARHFIIPALYGLSDFLGICSPQSCEISFD